MSLSRQDNDIPALELLTRLTRVWTDQRKKPADRSYDQTPSPSFYPAMSSMASLLTRPSTLGAIGVAGSGAFYFGLKYRTLTVPEVQRNSGSGSSQPGGKGQSYEVKSGREGGGV